MRMIRNIVLLAMSVSCIFSVGCAGEQSAEESSATAEITKPVIVPVARPKELSITLPSNFEEKSSDYCDQFYVCNDASVIITSEEQVIYGIKVDEYTENVKKGYSATADGYTLLSEKPVDTGTVNGKMLEFTYDIVGESTSQTMYCITAVFMENNTAYLVTCKCKNENALAFGGIFLNAIKTVSIAKKEADS